MRHELRTPLQIVLGGTDLLLNFTPNRERKQTNQMMDTSGKALLGLIDHILDISKIDAGHFELKESPFDLHALVSAVAEVLALQSKERETRLQVEMPTRCT